MNDKRNIKSKNRLKYYILSIVISVFISNLLAYKFKKLTDNDYLYRALRQDTKWEHDAYLEMINARYSFFHLTTVFQNGNSIEIYSYNWEVFFVSLFIMVVVLVIIHNTIYYDKLLQFIYRIKRTDKE